MTAREFKNYLVTITIISWLLSASVADKAKMENKTGKSYIKITTIARIGKTKGRR